MISSLNIHHIGVATRSIKEELKIFAQLGYSAASDIFVEPAQGVRGVFIESPDQPRLELLENINTEGEGTLSGYLQRGTKMYHVAYAVPCIENTLQELKNTGYYKVVVQPAEGVFFRRFCFIMLANMMLIELVEVR